MLNNQFVFFFPFQPTQTRQTSQGSENQRNPENIQERRQENQNVVVKEEPQQDVEPIQIKRRRFQGILKKNTESDESYVEEKREYRKKRYEIKKEFLCSMEGCDKKYGSIIAQRNHQRNVHGIRRRIKKSERDQ